MKKELKKENNSSLNEEKNQILFKKLSDLTNGIKSANPNNLKENVKLFYFTEKKRQKNNTHINIKNNVSPIKCISYKNYIKNNNYQLLKNFNISLTLYNSFIRSERPFTRNNYIKKEKQLIRNKNKTFEDFFNPIKNNKNNQFFHYTKLSQNNSQISIFNNKRITINKNNSNYKKKFIKNFHNLKNNDKTSFISNACDASTNTFGILNNKNNIISSKKPKRPLMIDYSHSEHKQLYYGFDKLRGKNKYKKPYFIVYKY